MDNSNNKMFWVSSLRPIYSILCGDLTATVSQTSTCRLLVGSAGVRLLSMMIPGSCASNSDLDSLVLNLSLSVPLFSTLFRCPLYECMMIVEGCTNPMRKMNVAPTYLYTK